MCIILQYVLFTCLLYFYVCMFSVILYALPGLKYNFTALRIIQKEIKETACAARLFHAKNYAMKLIL